MNERPVRIVLLFLDGVGLGDPDPARNPIAAARLPSFERWFGPAALFRTDRAARSARATRPDLYAAAGAADATLGIDGLPQSGTGQTTLFTGRNASALLGRHFGPWVPASLRDMLEAENLLVRARAAGRTVAFANAHPEGFFRSRYGRRPAAPPLIARAAGVFDRHAEELRRGRAVASSITNEAWRAHLDPSVPDVSAREAGEILADIADSAYLTLFAHYDTDHAGHRGGLEAGVAAIERVDAFLGGLLDALPRDSLLLITSDHGNLEDVGGGHTRNPVPVLAHGPGAEALVHRVRSLEDVAPALLALLGERHAGA